MKNFIFCAGYIRSSIHKPLRELALKQQVECKAIMTLKSTELIGGLVCSYENWQLAELLRRSCISSLVVYRICQSFATAKRLRVRGTIGVILQGLLIEIFKVKLNLDIEAINESFDISEYPYSLINELVLNLNSYFCWLDNMELYTQSTKELYVTKRI